MNPNTDSTCTNSNYIYADFDDSVSYVNKFIRTSTSNAAHIHADQHSSSLLTNSSWSFYIVCEQEIVGRYGNDLAGAFKHLHMFGKTSSQEKKKVNRAIIPVINHSVEHPDRILQYDQTTNSGKVMSGASIQFYMDCCFWQDTNTLKQMQIIVQNEYNILFPPTLSNAFTRGSCRHQSEEESEIIIDVSPELRGESQSMKIRHACYSYFESLVVQLDTLSSNHVMKTSEGGVRARK